MNAPYSFNFKYDPILENPFRFINKAIALDKDDINEFKEMLSKIQQ